MLHLYNSLTRKKELFSPRETGKAGMDVCGITVYDYCHIGLTRMFMVFDVLLRHVQVPGFNVHYVRSITDRDDDISAHAAENGETLRKLVSRLKKLAEKPHGDEAKCYGQKLHFVSPDYID